MIIPVKIFEAAQVKNPYPYVVFGGRYENNTEETYFGVNIRNIIANYNELSLRNFAIRSVNFTTNKSTHPDKTCTNYFALLYSYNANNGYLTARFDIDWTARTATIQFICLGGIPK